MRPLLLASALALAVPATLSGAGPAAAEKINLRDYWILAEIENPTTGEHASFRVDCTRGASLHCMGGANHPRDMHGAAIDRKRFQKGHAKQDRNIETIMVIADPDIEGVVGFAAAGAGGFAFRDRRWSRTMRPWPATMGARMDDLRSPGGLSRTIPTIRDGKWLETSDVIFTMWLVTPSELAIRDAEARRAPGAAGKAARKADRLKRRLTAVGDRIGGIGRSRGADRDPALERAEKALEALEKAVGRR